MFSRFLEKIEERIKLRRINAIIYLALRDSDEQIWRGNHRVSEDTLREQLLDTLFELGYTHDSFVDDDRPYRTRVENEHPESDSQRDWGLELRARLLSRELERRERAKARAEFVERQEKLREAFKDSLGELMREVENEDESLVIDGVDISEYDEEDLLDADDIEEMISEERESGGGDE